MTQPPASAGSPSRRPSTLDVEVRPLSPTEAGKVIEEILSSSTITGYSFDEWTRTRETLVVTDPATGQLVAASLCHHLVGGWTELAVLFVLDGHRGRGVGSMLLDRTIRHLRASRRRTVMFFCDEQMRHLALRTGFVVHDDESSFARGSLRRHLFIRSLYKPQWLADPYRRRELRRKRQELKCSFAFKIAVVDG